MNTEFIKNAQIACKENEYVGIIQKIYTGYAEDESYEIWKGDNSTGSLVYSYHGQNNDTLTTTRVFKCFEEAQYTMILKSDDGYGWGTSYSPSRLSVIYGDTELVHATIDWKYNSERYEKIISFTFHVDVPFGIQIKYTDIPQEGNDWKFPDYNDSDWLVATSGQLPSVNVTTRYYRLSTLLPENTYALTSINYIIQTDGGIIVYTNGNEVYKYNMPIGIINSKCSAIQETPEENELKSFTIYKGFIPSVQFASNVITAIEIHGYISKDIHEKYIDIERTDIFDISLQWITLEDGECTNNRLYEGTFDCSEPPNQPLNACKRIYDNSVKSYYESASGKSVNTTYYLQNGRSEYISEYFISVGEGSGYPTEWNIYGSNDNVTWEHLDYQFNITLEFLRPNRTIPLRSNKRSYSMFRLEILNALRDQVTLTSFQVHICNYPLIPEGIVYPITVYSDSIYHNTLTISPISSNFNHYTILTSIPTGVSIDPVTGVLSGRPRKIETIETVIQAIYLYDGSKVNTTILFMIYDCEQPFNSLLEFRKINYLSAAWEHFYVYTLSDELIYTHDFMEDNTVFVYTMCIPSDIYKIVLFADVKKSWEKDSKLIIKQGWNSTEFYTLVETTLGDSKNGIEYINTKLLIDPRSNLWIYLTDVIPNNWYDIPYNDNSWTIADYNKQEENHSSIWLLRTHFYIEDLSIYSSFEIRLGIHSGYVIYINGRYYYSQYLSSIPITNETKTTHTRFDITEWYSITGPVEVLKEGEINLISVGIIYNKEDLPSIMDFDGTLQLYMYSNFTRDYLATYKTNDYKYDARPLFDRKISSIYQYPTLSNEPLFVYIHMDYKRNNYINKYCITSTQSTSDYDLASWTFYGVDTMEQYHVLHDVQSTTFITRNQIRCFYLPFNTIPYKDYKFVFNKPLLTSIRDSHLSIAEISLLVENKFSLIIPPFYVTPTHISTFINTPFNPITISSPYYTSFSISPSLPMPLILDDTNGNILGIPISSFTSTQYILSAISFLGFNVSEAITISVQPCIHDFVSISIYMEGGKYASDQGFILRNNESKIYYTQENIAHYSKHKYTYCIPIDTYEFVIYSKNKHGWDQSYFSIYLNDKALLLEGSLEESNNNKSYILNLNYILFPNDSQTRYIQPNEEMPSNWIQPSYNDASWIPVQMDSLPSPIRSTLYLRNTILLSSEYISYILTIRSRIGIIAYWDGNEIIRENIKTPSNIYTSATTLFETIQDYYQSIIISEEDGKQQFHTLAIEIHPYIIVEIIPSFDCTLLPVINNMILSIHGEPSSDILNENTIDFLVDNNYNTIYRSGPRCIGTIYTYTYPRHSKYLINNYSLSTSLYCNTQNPSGWLFEASNDNITWILLDSRENILFTTQNETKQFIFANTQAYNIYRLTVTECNNKHLISNELDEDCYYKRTQEQGSQLADFSLSYLNKELSCQPIDGYNGAYENTYSYKQCNKNYMGRYQRLCINNTLSIEEDYCINQPLQEFYYTSDFYEGFIDEYITITPTIIGVNYTCTCTPSLPLSLTLDTSTGIISGFFKETINNTNYLITCSNSKNSLHTIIQIHSIQNASTSIITWIIVSILCMALCVLISFVFIFILHQYRKKQQQQDEIPVLSFPDA
ncbi:hypothetical protein WA158_008510 [Blastocystis sp. Blastoise]